MHQLSEIEKDLIKRLKLLANGGGFTPSFDAMVEELRLKAAHARERDQMHESLRRHIELPSPEIKPIKPQKIEFKPNLIIQNNLQIIVYENENSLTDVDEGGKQL